VDSPGASSSEWRQSLCFPGKPWAAADIVFPASVAHVEPGFAGHELVDPVRRISSFDTNSPKLVDLFVPLLVHGAQRVEPVDDQYLVRLAVTV
jgi:hypothetical protein